MLDGWIESCVHVVVVGGGGGSATAPGKYLLLYDYIPLSNYKRSAKGSCLSADSCASVERGNEITIQLERK